MKQTVKVFLISFSFVDILYNKSCFYIYINWSWTLSSYVLMLVPNSRIQQKRQPRYFYPCWLSGIMIGCFPSVVELPCECDDNNLESSQERGSTAAYFIIIHFTDCANYAIKACMHSWFSFCSKRWLLLIIIKVNYYC